MIRARRYRVFVVFAVFSVFALFHLFGIAGWLSSVPEVRSTTVQQNQNPFPRIGFPESNDNDLSHPHGFAPEPSLAPLVPPLVDDPFADESIVDLPIDIPSSFESLTPELPRDPVTQEDGFLQGGKGRLEVPDLDRGAIRWEKHPEHFPVPSSDIIPLPTGSPKAVPKIQFDFPEETVQEKQVREETLEIIKETFLHAWNGYKEHAMGRDEVAPVSGTPRDPFMGWGATLVDSLDTLWIMGFQEEFEEAVEETRKLDIGTSKRKDIPVFETVIRYLGGLIGAYDISGGKYPVLLEKAVELAEILMGAFDTPNRMPATYYNWAPAYTSQPHRAGSRVVLAELGSLSVEFTRLAQLTKKDKYYDAIARIMNELEAWQNHTHLPGLWPAHLDASGCKKLPSIDQPVTRDTIAPSRVSNKGASKRDTPVKDPLLEGAQLADYDSKPQPDEDSAQTTASNIKPQPKDGPGVLSDYECEKAGLQSAAQRTKPDRFTLGALADSAYEYLPKEYMLLGGLLDQYRTMYETAMDTTRKHLLFRPMLPDNRDVRFIASATPVQVPVNGKFFEYKYEGSHLHCYAGGMFGIGAKVFGLDGDLDIAKKLTDGCVWAYESTQSGIMPEHFSLLPCESMKSCEWNQTAYYDALDPFEDIRISRLEAWEELKEKLGEHIPAPEKTDTPVSEQTQVGQDEKDGLDLRRRDTPTKTVGRDMRNPVPNALGPKPSVLSHAEFAEKRIKEDRIPPGMVEVSSPKYVLRPEAIESVFIMYRITGDDDWRRKGWKMFESIATNTRTEIAHSAIKDVTSEVPFFTDVMESFWLGETLKYFYLLFSDPQVVSLDEYILNTEAHPHKRPSSV